MNEMCYICVKTWMMGDDNSFGEERMVGAFGARTLDLIPTWRLRTCSGPCDLSPYWGK